MKYCPNCNHPEEHHTQAAYVSYETCPNNHITAGCMKCIINLDRRLVSETVNQELKTYLKKKLLR